MSYEAISYEHVDRRFRIAIALVSILCSVLFISGIYFSTHYTIRFKTDADRKKALATENRVNAAVPDEIGKLPNGNKLMRVTVLDQQRNPSYYFYEEISK